jgi:hypothetical protein
MATNDMPDPREMAIITEKALHTLHGILRGISIDGEIHMDDINEIKSWAEKYPNLRNAHPFDKVIPYVQKILDDSKVTESEIETLEWLIEQFDASDDPMDLVMTKREELEGILHGIIADGFVSDREIETLSAWLRENAELEGVYPYDELRARLAEIAESGIAERSRTELASFIEGALKEER